MEAIEFDAALWKIQTLVDGSYRITLDLGEYEIGAITDLLKCKKGNAMLKVAVIPVKQEEKWRFNSDPSTLFDTR